MWRIRQEQLDALDRAHRARGARSLAAMLRDDLGEAISAISDDDLQKRMGVVIERAAARGVTLVPDLRRYAAVALRWGVSFDVDPRLGWAAAALSDAEVTSVSERVLALHTLSERRAARSRD